MKLVLPFSVTLPRKKKEDKVWILNLNNYRNTHFHILNAAKVVWHDMIARLVMNSPKRISCPPYRFVYTVYPKDNRSFDLSNVLSVVEKFTNDALIECGVLTNDNCKIIPQVDYRHGGVSKDNPRIELEMKNIDTTFEIAEEIGL